MQAYAHTDPRHPDGEDAENYWEPLFTPFGKCETECKEEECEKCATLERFHGHINKVAWMASRFSEAMFPAGSDEAKAAKRWGQLLGFWHDLGKFSPIWQDYLKQKSDPHADEISGKVDHSTAGAQHAALVAATFGRLLAYPIAGHHSGLPDGIDSSLSSLENRLKKSIPVISAAPDKILDLHGETPPPGFAMKNGFSLAFFVRMIFSALTDADFLATEAFMSPERTELRPAEPPSLIEIEKALAGYLEKFSPEVSPVNKIRAEVLSRCLEMSEQPPGLFSLNVPTGGGKTLSSLAFAIRHARIHGLRRVVCVIPFTSIIEQNAAVFRRALSELGPDLVVEHHCNLNPESEHATVRSRLASENWDARIIVTTNVQFFESLHSNRTSRCRKLHRLARSVIIFDEVQTLPVDYLSPCLRSMEELIAHYGSTIVLCTATQPSLEKQPDFPIGISVAKKIIPDPESLHRRLRRVNAVHLGKKTNEELLGLLCDEEQALCIVNTRRHARQLFDMLPVDGSQFHLSALMCPAHRSVKLNQIRTRLNYSLPVHLISTQLVEAGVDIDFPTVFRSLAGLDSISQAAGRCDREGRITAALGRPGGKLFVFVPPELPPAGFLRASAESGAGQKSQAASLAAGFIQRRALSCSMALMFLSSLQAFSK